MTSTSPTVHATRPTPRPTSRRTADHPLPLGTVTRPADGIDIARSDADFADVRRLWLDYAAWISAAARVHLADADPSFAGHVLDPRRTFSSPHAVLIARDRRRTVATIGIEVDGERAVFHRFYVAPQARGLGIGRRLLDAAIATCEATRVERIDLHTAPHYMTAASALYAERGFTVAGEDEHVCGVTLRPMCRMLSQDTPVADQLTAL
ncbi:MAG: GNAT family N-acetyltransferase [Actinomycetota bacterium]